MGSFVEELNNICNGDCDSCKTKSCDSGCRDESSAESGNMM